MAKLEGIKLYSSWTNDTLTECTGTYLYQTNLHWKHIPHFLCNPSLCFYLVTKSSSTPCDPMDHSPPGSCVHGIFQARIIKWVAISFPRVSSQPRYKTHISCLAGGFFTTEPPRSSLHNNSNIEVESPTVVVGSDREAFKYHIFHQN